MKRLFDVLGGLIALGFLAWCLLLLVEGCGLKERAEEALYDARYEYDPRNYPYSADCPVELEFEARCNPDALHDWRYSRFDGPRRPIPANCTERVVHEFFRNLPEGALEEISNFDERAKISRCSSTIDYPTESGGFTTHVEVRGYVFREQPVLSVRLPGKHLGEPRGFDSFEWLGEEVIEFEGDIRQETPHVRIHTGAGEEFECLYNRFDGFVFATEASLKPAFVCAADLDVAKAFVTDPPTRSVGPPLREDE